MNTRLLFFVFFLLIGCTTSSSTNAVRDMETLAAKGGYAGARKTHEAFANNIMVASQGEYSTAAGLKIARLGGNAVDVAAAVSFAIAVERPQSTGIGGGGFMLLHRAKQNKTVAIDFREKAPAAATERMYQDPKTGEVIPGLSTDGALASGVPGLVAGVLQAFETYGSGKVSRAQILAPAIELAEKGFVVYEHLARAIEAKKDLLARFPASRATFFTDAGVPLKAGDTLRQPRLGATLREIAKEGKDGFYDGWVADAIVSQQRSLHGLITYGDLESYDVKERLPVVGTFRGFKIASMPPPSSGGIHVIQILNMLEGFPLAKWGRLDPKTIHYTSAAMQQAFADRAKFLGDPDFVPNPIPVAGLLSKQYAKKQIGMVEPGKARSSSSDFKKVSGGVSEGNPFPYESSETTHFSVMDIQGNTVASTQTINGWFGSGVVVEKAGFLMNNQMDDFSAKPGVANIFGAIGGRQNAVAPRKRPLSSMSPTILFKAGKPVLALGSPSGTRIISCVAHTLLNYTEYKLPLYESVSSLRYHHQWFPDEVRVGPPYFDEKTKENLESLGYAINETPLGCRIQAIAREKGRLHGVSDPRGAGKSQGL